MSLVYLFLFFPLSLFLTPIGFFATLAFFLHYFSVRRHKTKMHRDYKRPHDDYSKSTCSELAWLANSILNAPVEIGSLLFVDSVNCTDNKKTSFVILQFEQHTKLCFFLIKNEKNNYQQTFLIEKTILSNVQWNTLQRCKKGRSIMSTMCQRIVSARKKKCNHSIEIKMNTFALLKIQRVCLKIINTTLFTFSWQK